jgi:hypothetical protein
VSALNVRFSIVNVLEPDAATVVVAPAPVVAPDDLLEPLHPPSTSNTTNTTPIDLV